VSFSEREEALFVGSVKAGSWAISRAMDDFVRMVIPLPPQKLWDVKAQNLSSSDVLGRHVGAIVQGSLEGSMKAEEILFWNTWSSW
jgi:hypothetical protein